MFVSGWKFRRGKLTTPFGTDYVGWSIDTGWDGSGPVFNPFFQERVYDEWKPVKPLIETWTSNTDGVVSTH